MCLILLSCGSHPRYKLIIAANRDEFYRRKTAAAEFWPDHPDILGGRDLLALGTWMGITKRGRLSLLTNFRDPANIDPNAPSRGKLVSDYLEGQDDGETYLQRVAHGDKAYNGFNLLAGTADTLFYYSNYFGDVVRIEPGIHALSNHLLDTPWPKVERGKIKLANAIRSDQLTAHDLFDLLYDDVQAPDGKLPTTGVGLDRERVLSSMFIKSPGYGSRCSTALLVDKSNHVLFAERVYNTATFSFSEQQFEFDAQPSAP